MFVEGPGMNLKKKISFLVSLFVFSLPLFSQSAALILEYINMSDVHSMEKTINQIRNKLSEELERQNLEYLDESYVSSTLRADGITPEQYLFQNIALKLGLTAEVPVVITVSVQEKGTLLEISVTAWDVAGARKITTERSISKSEVTRYIMINSSITQVVSELSGDYGLDIVQEDPKVHKITFISNQEDMEIYLPDGELLGHITHSVLNVTDREYELGTKLLITKKLKGFRTGEQYIFLDKEKSAVPLSDLKKAQTMALEMNWTYTQLMGIGSGFRYYLIPDWMYISFDSYFYLQRDFSTPDGNDLLHSDMRLLAGLYLGFGPESIFRINVSIGVGVILTMPLHKSANYTDFYLNPINISFELNFDDWAFYLRPELRIAMGIGENNLLGGGILHSDYYIPPITIGVLRKW